MECPSAGAAITMLMCACGTIMRMRMAAPAEKWINFYWRVKYIKRRGRRVAQGIGQMIPRRNNLGINKPMTHDDQGSTETRMRWGRSGVGRLLRVWCVSSENRKKGTGSLALLLSNHPSVRKRGNRTTKNNVRWVRCARREHLRQLQVHTGRRKSRAASLSLA